MGAYETINDFVQVRDKPPAQPSDLEKLHDDIVEMHEGMRQEPDRSDKVYFDLEHGVGGITGLEFMVQYAVLRWAHKHHELLAVTDSLRLLEILTRFGLRCRHWYWATECLFRLSYGSSPSCVARSRRTFST